MTILIVKIIELLITLLTIYGYVIIARCLMSFVQPSFHNPFVRFIYQITDPVMDSMRRSLPFLVLEGLDLSPIAILFLIFFSKQILANFAIRLIASSMGG